MIFLYNKQGGLLAARHNNFCGARIVPLHAWKTAIFLDRQGPGHGASMQ
jgi:hypothetical protein